MEISRNKFVTLSYKLHLNDINGELVEETQDNQPLEFIFGAGRMLPAFEKHLEGLKTGKEFNFSLNPDDAYGQVNPEAIVDIPRNIFEQDGKINEKIIKLGNTVPMQDAQGNRLNGIVLEITDETVKMDFNHPLAGEKLNFSGEIKSVREATEEELLALVNEHSGGCSGCSCDDDCGSGGCGC